MILKIQLWLYGGKNTHTRNNRMSLDGGAAAGAVGTNKSLKYHFIIIFYELFVESITWTVSLYPIGVVDANYIRQCVSKIIKR